MESFYKNSEIELREFAAKEKLEIVNGRGGAAHFARPPIPSRAQRGEERIPFELIQEYAANWNLARKKAHPRGAFRAAS